MKSQWKYYLDEAEQESEVFSMFDESYEDQISQWNFRSVLTHQYHVICTNSPYMGVSNVSVKVQKYVKKNFLDSEIEIKRT